MASPKPQFQPINAIQVSSKNLIVERNSSKDGEDLDLLVEDNASQPENADNEREQDKDENENEDEDDVEDGAVATPRQSLNTERVFSITQAEKDALMDNLKLEGKH